MNRAAILSVLITILALPACEDEVICTRELISMTGAGFYVRDAAGQRDTVLSNLTFYALERPDSLLYESSSGVSAIEFPLPQNPGESTAFILETGTGTDTLRVFHSSRLELVSYSCGYTTVYELEGLEYGHNVIDTVSIINPYVNLTDDENLKIYLRPAVPEP